MKRFPFPAVGELVGVADAIEQRRNLQRDPADYSRRRRGVRRSGDSEERWHAPGVHLRDT